MKQFVVVRRSALPVPRTNVYGPFESAKSASAWGRGEFRTSGDWAVVRITAATSRMVLAAS